MCTKESMENDIVLDLLRIPGVSSVEENHQISDAEHRDADFKIYLLNRSGVEEIRELLSPLGLTAYCDDDEIFKIS